ncbi:MAG: class I SAM-dependent methyltransferase [Bacteroidota bacterium]|nr:class I SAM-dependent methyltransferase [Bacteroidota bacterium]
MKEKWDERFARAEYVYGTDPNVFFREILSSLQPGRILLPAEGEGRNAVYAAESGWEVHTFDFSEQARTKALALAAERRVEITYDIADLETYRFPISAYDAVGLFFVHMPPALRRRVHTACARSLRPGGTLVLEAFSKRQRGYESGGPRDENLLYTVDTLVEDFSSLQCSLCEERVVVFDEGEFHRGEGCVVRFVGTLLSAGSDESLTGVNPPPFSP